MLIINLCVYYYQLIYFEIFAILANSQVLSCGKL